MRRRRLITHDDLAVLTPAKEPFIRAGWLFELKYGGFRVLTHNDADGGRMISRNGTDVITKFPEIASDLGTLPPLILDGELVIFDDMGRAQFAPLVRRRSLTREKTIAKASGATPAVLLAFDLLYLRGEDMRDEPLTVRKTLLRSVLNPGGRVQYVEHVETDGERLYNMGAELGVEGIIARPDNTPYRKGRLSGWLKIKVGGGRWRWR